MAVVARIEPIEVLMKPIEVLVKPGVIYAPRDYPHATTTYHKSTCKVDTSMVFRV